MCTFCVNDAHADLVVHLLKRAFEQHYGSIDDDAVIKITGAADKPLQLIRRYKNERNPNVAVTVDLLTTGVDVPEISLIGTVLWLAGLWFMSRSLRLGMGLQLLSTGMFAVLNVQVGAYPGLVGATVSPAASTNTRTMCPFEGTPASLMKNSR